MQARNFLTELSVRNRVLFLFGWLNALAALICLVCIFTTHISVLGINAFYKPMKFFLSIWIFCWSMGWYMSLLDAKKKVYRYSVAIILIFCFEMAVIVWQAANGRMSHFNNSTVFYGILFNLMGVAITILVGWTISITLLFFRQKLFNVEQPYLWGIRLGLILFIFFSLEGFAMVAVLRHTIGAADGEPGIPVMNWSRLHGDLRVAHFFGMHGLQILPLAGYYFLKTKKQVFFMAILYFVFTAALLAEAYSGKPLFGY